MFPGEHPGGDTCRYTPRISSRSLTRTVSFATKAPPTDGVTDTNRTNSSGSRYRTDEDGVERERVEHRQREDTRELDAHDPQSTSSRHTAGVRRQGDVAQGGGREWDGQRRARLGRRPTAYRVWRRARDDGDSQYRYQTGSYRDIEARHQPLRRGNMSYS